MRQNEFFKSNKRDKGFMLYKTNHPFDCRTFPQAFFSIIGLFARDSHFHIQNCWGHGGTLNITTVCQGKCGHLYMHYNSVPDHRLIVSNIEFIHKRQGYMTELFAILKEIRRSYHTGPIVIESVLSDEMEAWCKKNGFVIDPRNKGNYIWPPTAITVTREP